MSISYFLVASFAAVVYDWTLRFGQEFELVWRQRWFHTTLLYLSVRYAGLLYTVVVMLSSLPSVSITDAGCNEMYIVQNWMTVVIIAMLCGIVTSRLHAMYQRSRKMLIFLIAIFLPVTTACGVLTAIGNSHVSGEEAVLSGSYLCQYDYEGVATLLMSMTWILCTVWEVLILCLAVGIAVNQFRELPMGWTIVNCFTVLIRTPMVYYVFSVAVFSLGLGGFAPKLSVLRILLFVQMFVLGPRLILSVREYDAKLAVNSDAGTFLSTIVFQERDFVSTGSDV